MGRPASPYFDDYRGAFGARKPDLSRQRNEDEVTDLSSHEDVFFVTTAPAERVVAGRPPTRGGSSGSGMYIWLVLPDDVVAALEEGAAGQSTRRERLAHSNLSGGALAHAGGELWYADDSKIWLTGGSSRYQPRDENELTEIVEAFRTSGYTVCSCGWDTELDGPARYFRGHETWLSNHG